MVLASSSSSFVMRASLLHPYNHPFSFIVDYYLLGSLLS